MAVLVLGVGIMGFAASQLHSLHGAKSSWWQWQAQTLAREMVEHVRAAGGLVAADIREDWQRRVADRLPQGSVDIRWPAGEGAEGAIIIQWGGSADAPMHRLKWPFRA